MHLNQVLALQRVEELVLAGVDMQGCVRQGRHLLHHTERTAGAGGVGVDDDVNLPEGEAFSKAHLNSPCGRDSSNKYSITQSTELARERRARSLQ